MPGWGKRGVKARFVSTFIANILRAGLSFLTGLVIARTLGPSDYGHLSFLLGSFAAVANLVDMASSHAFYTFISQKQRGRQFFRYYAFWVLTQLFILLILVFLLPASFRQEIWLEHPKALILLVLFASFAMNQLWRFVAQIGESIRDTVAVQIRHLALAAAYLGCVAVLAGFSVVSVRTILVLQFMLYLLFSGLYAWRLYHGGILSKEGEEDFKGVLKEFTSYCSPLAISVGIGFLYSFGDYWLLQKFGGSVQQGYYAIGARFAAVSLIATASMLRVFWKEIAEAHSLEDMARVRLLYRRVSRGLYFIGAVISCLMIPFSREILTLFLGASYQAAWLPLSLMLLYPIHQSTGQITGTMLLATEETKTQSLIDIVFMVVSIPTAYILLAPTSAMVPGLQLGAMGLALKMVGCQILGVNLKAFFVARHIGAAFNWSHQIIVLLVLLPVGFGSKFLADSMLSLASLDGYIIPGVVASSVFYVVSVTALIYHVPSLAGVDRDQVKHGLSLLRARVKRL